MKALLKSVLTSVLGEDATLDLLRGLRGQPLVFSEANLIIRWFRANPRSGVIVDVGSHFGESFAPYLALGWQVLAFEPDPANRARLLQNVAAERIRLFGCAVSDHEEEGGHSSRVQNRTAFSACPPSAKPIRKSTACD